MTLQQPSLSFHTVVHALRASAPVQVLQILARTAAHQIHLDPRILASDLVAAEKRAGSGIGGGVALVQMKVFGIDSPFLLLAQLAEAVPFAVPDNRPVDIVALLLSPNKDGPLHLQRLARLTRFLRDDALLGQLRAAESEDALLSLLMPENREFLAA